MPRRVRVGRPTSGETKVFSKEQQLEIRGMIEGAVKPLQEEIVALTVRLSDAEVYNHNISVILRDMQSAVALAKYSDGSTKNLLDELIHNMESGLENVTHLRPEGGGGDAPRQFTEVVNHLVNAGIASREDALAYDIAARRALNTADSTRPRDRDTELRQRGSDNHDPVEDVSDF